MGHMLHNFTDGLGNARQALRNGQERFETAPELPGDDEPDVDGMTDEVIAVIGRACRANVRDPKACADLLRSAAEMLTALAQEVEA